jgi:uncharacterized membrane protein
MIKLNKRASFDKLIGFAVAISTLVIIVIVTLMVASSGKSEISNLAGNESLEYNSSLKTVEGFSLIPTFLPMIVLAGIGVAVLGIIALLKTRY